MMKRKMTFFFSSDFHPPGGGLKRRHETMQDNGDDLFVMRKCIALNTQKTKKQLRIGLFLI